MLGISTLDFRYSKEQELMMLLTAYACHLLDHSGSRTGGCYHPSEDQECAAHEGYLRDLEVRFCEMEESCTLLEAPYASWWLPFGHGRRHRRLLLQHKQVLSTAQYVQINMEPKHDFPFQSGDV